MFTCDTSHFVFHIINIHIVSCGVGWPRPTHTYDGENKIRKNSILLSQLNPSNLNNI